MCTIKFLDSIDLNPNINLMLLYVCTYIQSVLYDYLYHYINKMIDIFIVLTIAIK